LRRLLGRASSEGEEPLYILPGGPSCTLYFSVITLTTVGYGDFSPSTTAGNIFTMCYIFIGIGIFLGFVNAVAERSMEQRGEIRSLLERRSKGEGSEREED
jgi:voltage-gated potassium channel